ncbi:alginate export family protein [Tellurirhabdus rosea]|uniref:alginate export family protein n=1 Tax=Tellurirhabdus rosea TaxID=2674997 RepID=UPI00225B8197|nr:alginate export family protein [Tellurirhabdus rosea]
MRKLVHPKTLLGFVGLSLLSLNVQAQFTLGGQLRTRSEYRDGQGTLLKVGDKPAFFTSQRTRVTASYTGYRLKFGATLQDVRVWGQDASTINRVTNQDFNGLLMHEAWGEVSLLDTTVKTREFALKVGRQELVYDDSRLLGNLDWLQQGRRHDMALLKYAANGWMLHAGVAYNQNAERKTGAIYNGIPTGYTAGTNAIGSLYKSLQFVYLGRKFYAGNFSFLVIKDDFNKYAMTLPAGSTVATRTNIPGVWSRVTFGGYFTGQFKKLGLKGEAYYQTGKDKDGLTVKAALLSGQLTYNTSRRTSLGLGLDYTTGNEPTASGTTTRRFDPLYGTPHKFWGLMDYFYVADGFGRGGLTDLYFRARYKPTDKLNFALDAHSFRSPNTVLSGDKKELSQNFGEEIDLIANYTLTKNIGLEGGYCTFLATESLAAASVKNVTTPQKRSNWAYLMVNLKF